MPIFFLAAACGEPDTSIVTLPPKPCELKLGGSVPTAGIRDVFTQLDKTCGLFPDASENAACQSQVRGLWDSARQALEDPRNGIFVEANNTPEDVIPGGSVLSQLVVAPEDPLSNWYSGLYASGETGMIEGQNPTTWWELRSDADAPPPAPTSSTAFAIGASTFRSDPQIDVVVFGSDGRVEQAASWTQSGNTLELTLVASDGEITHQSIDTESLAAERSSAAEKAAKAVGKVADSEYAKLNTNPPQAYSAPAIAVETTALTSMAIPGFEDALGVCLP